MSSRAGELMVVKKADRTLGLFLVCAVILSGSVNLKAEAEKQEHSDAILIAVSTVQCFADYANAGLPMLATQLLPAEWTVDGVKYDARAEVLSLLSARASEPEMPTIIVAKRHATLLNERTVEVRFVAIWNIAQSGGRTTRVITNERFVVDIAAGANKIIEAGTLPIVARYGHRPNDLRRELVKAGLTAP
jgi:hypothetical protein